MLLNQRIIEPLELCCNFATPIVYGEGMSQLEDICKIGTKVNELIGFFNDDLSVELEKYIDQRFNDILMATAYEEETETLILYIKTK